MIKVEKESVETQKMFGGTIENCHFCNKPTQFWNTYTNNPVCQPCAKVHDISELPDHGAEIRKQKLKKKSA